MFCRVRIHVTVVKEAGRDVCRVGPRVWRSGDGIETRGKGLVGRVRTSILLLLLLADER